MSYPSRRRSVEEPRNDVCTPEISSLRLTGSEWATAGGTEVRLLMPGAELKCPYEQQEGTLHRCRGPRRRLRLHGSFFGRLNRAGGNNDQRAVEMLDKLVGKTTEDDP